MNNSTTLSKRKVLIADDDEDSRLLLNVLLSEEGWEVFEASNGEEALLKVVEESPDILILDNRMPELSGTEVYKTIQDQKIRLAIVLITAYPDLEQLATSLGIDYFLTKPFNFSDLFKIVNLAYQSLQEN